MWIRETEAFLMSMLGDAGVDPSRVTAAEVRATVEVFRAFAVLPVEGAALSEEDGDGVLAQCGRDERGFSADLTRQFIEAGGGDFRTWQLSCSFRWGAGAGAEMVAPGHLWSFGRDFGEFFADAMALPGWAWALEGRETPRELTIALTEV
ncbi:hypothetical protein GCM10010435_35200 [Winogradskya consettensis]|uniref:Uncharacterized protein n=1 Tax=Winogradskya consettensis TaxID=113560 RepID=A0A919VZB3_9ACTN|nr:hypothetical protein [Actinoplanes consettensis]GIM74473.1 hypothetical protein Aco04nite_40520 [Actinoplanes consettensis]